MPAQEFIYWQSYFSIFPFTQDREDWHAAMISVTIANYLGMLLAQNSGRRSYKPVSVEAFLPDYLGTRKPAKVVEKSVEQQHMEMAAFVEKLKAAQGIQ